MRAYFDITKGLGQVLVLRAQQTDAAGAAVTTATVVFKLYKEVLSAGPALAHHIFDLTDDTFKPEASLTDPEDGDIAATHWQLGEYRALVDLSGLAVSVIQSGDQLIVVELVTVGGVTYSEVHYITVERKKEALAVLTNASEVDASVTPSVEIIYDDDGSTVLASRQITDASAAKVNALPSGTAAQRTANTI